jgi:hypothetical protein
VVFPPRFTVTVSVEPAPSLRIGGGTESHDAGAGVKLAVSLIGPFIVTVEALTVPRVRTCAGASPGTKLKPLFGVAMIGTLCPLLKNP